MFVSLQGQVNTRHAVKENSSTPSPTKTLTQAFTLTFLAEWGDRSQIATIALAAAKDPFGVTIGKSVVAGWNDACTPLPLVHPCSYNARFCLAMGEGGIIGHALCTGIAVIGGRMLAARISERTVSYVCCGLYDICVKCVGGLLTPRCVVYLLHDRWPSWGASCSWVSAFTRS